MLAPKPCNPHTWSSSTLGRSGWGGEWGEGRSRSRCETEGFGRSKPGVNAGNLGFLGVRVQGFGNVTLREPRPLALQIGSCWL